MLDEIENSGNQEFSEQNMANLIAKER